MTELVLEKEVLEYQFYILYTCALCHSPGAWQSDTVQRGVKINREKLQVANIDVNVNGHSYRSCHCITHPIRQASGLV